MQFFLAFFSVSLFLLIASLHAHAHDSSVSFNDQDARSIARKALTDGKTKTAETISSALLRQDPNDADGLLIRAHLRRASGQLDAALKNAKRAWRLAERSALRFEAAYLVAGILTQQEKFTRAQFWLRRADQVAPNEAFRRRTAQAFANVKRRNPLQLQFRFSVKPSNNVNNGAETTEVEIGGLPFRLDDSGVRLSGWEGSVGLSFGYKLSEGRRHRTDFLSEIFYRKVWLSSNAARLAPTVRGSEFDYGAIAFGARHRRLLWPDLGPSTVFGVIGKSWYGGNSLARWGEIRLEQVVRTGNHSLVQYGLLAREEKRLDNAANDSSTLGISAIYKSAFGSDRSYSFGAIAKDIKSNSATVDSLVLGLQASRSFGRLGSATPKLHVTAETRDYREWIATPGGRKDKTLGLRLDLTWPTISFYGFIPRTSLSARRTWSNVNIYDRDELSLGLTAISRF